MAYPAAETLAPGRVRHVEGERFPVGELDGSASARAQAISGAFTRAGFQSPVLADIRSAHDALESRRTIGAAILVP